jgi:hypothetical protein
MVDTNTTSIGRRGHVRGTLEDVVCYIPSHRGLNATRKDGKPGYSCDEISLLRCRRGVLEEADEQRECCE